MSKIQEIINRQDRKTFYYDGSRIMYRYRKKRAKPKPKPAPIPEPVKTITSYNVKTGVSAQSKIGRYKGGSTARAYDSSYHLKSRKTSRKKARETRRKKLSKRPKRNRYAQLM